MPGDCSDGKLWGRHPVTVLKRQAVTLRGNGVNAFRQSKGNSCGAADRRPDEAWGSLPGRSAARIFVEED